MPKVACARCGVPYNPGALLYADDGQICVDCDALQQANTARNSKVQSLILSGPVLSVAGVAGLAGGLIPLLGLVFLTVVPFMGLVGFVQGVRAVMASQREPDLTPNQKVGLMASGVISMVWCVGLMVAGTGFLVLALLATAITVL